MRFHVKAVALDGSPYEAVVSAGRAGALIRRLREQGYKITSIRRERVRRALPRAGRVQAQDMELVCRELSTFLNAGAPLPEALRAVGRGLDRRPLQQALHSLAARVESGEALSEALAAQPGQFPPLFRFLVQAGSAAGRLGPALLLLADYYQTTERLRRRLAEAAVYPLFLAVVMAVLIGAATWFLAPQLAQAFTLYNLPLPAPTRWAVTALRSAPVWIPIAAAAIVVGILSAALFRRAPACQDAATRALLHAPLLGGLMRAYLTARMSAGLALLLESEAPLPDALRLLADAECNPYAQRVARAMAQEVERGGRLSEAMEHASAALFPRTFFWIVSATEGSAALAESCRRLSELYAAVARSRLQIIEALAPALTVTVMGGLTLTAAAILLAPLLQAYYAF